MAGNREAVAAPEGGLAIPLGNLDRLGHAMIDLADDPDLHATAGPFNRNRGLAEYHIGAVIEKIEQECESLLSAAS